MSLVRGSEHWVAGSRFYFKRDPDADDGTLYPYMDLGVLKDCNPAVTPTELQLEDPDGGVSVIVDRELSKIEMVVNGTCADFNPDNLAIVFYGKKVESFTQAGDPDGAIELAARNGKLVKLCGYDASATPVYNIASVQAVVSAGSFSTYTVSAITTTHTLTLTEAATIPDNAYIVLTRTGLTTAGNSRVLRVNGAVSNSVTVVVDETLTNETVTAKLFVPSDGETGTLLTAGDATDGYEIVSLQRGLIRVGTAVFTSLINDANVGGAVAVAYTKTAYSGKRKIDLLSAGTIRGKGILILGRGANARQTAIEFDCSLAAQTTSLTNTDFSTWQFQATVLGDVTGVSSGRILQFIGGVPTGF